MTTKVFKEEICDYLSALENEYITLLKNMIMEKHHRNVREIIEQNTDAYSVFHYSTIKILDENKQLWGVTEISSKNSAIINKDKEFVLPFGPYKDIERYMDNPSEFHCETYKNKNSLSTKNMIKKESIENIIKDLKSGEVNFLLEVCIDFCEKNREVVKKNTELLESSSVPHSIFDYKKSLFFTNNHNKRYFALLPKDGKKWGLVDAKGELIAPFIYDDLGFFTSGEGDYIHMGIGGKYGLLDCLGHVVVDAISDNVVSFHEGFAIIQQDKKFGYADTSGNIVIPVIYDCAARFIFGKAEVEQNGEKFYIDREGKRIEKC